MRAEKDENRSNRCVTVAKSQEHQILIALGRFFECLMSLWWEKQKFGLIFLLSQSQLEEKAQKRQNYGKKMDANKITSGYDMIVTVMG